MDQFIVSDFCEIVYYLRKLILTREYIRAQIDGGEGFVTLLLALDQENELLIFDGSGAERVNRSLLGSNRTVFSATPRGVHHQFDVFAVFPVVHDRNPAFAAKIPSKLLRVQRRECYRGVVPQGVPARCIVPSSDGGPYLSLRLINISSGGVALEIEDGNPVVNVVGVISDASIDVFGWHLSGLTLNVKSVHRNDNGSAYVGCSFAKLTQSQDKLLQLIILGLQRSEINFARNSFALDEA